MTHKPDVRTATGGSAARSVELEVGVNQTEVPAGETSTNVETDVDVSQNGHGTLTTRRRKVTHKPVTKTARGGTALYDEEETSTINDEEQPSESGGSGRTVTCRANPNEHGSATTTKVVRTAKAKSESVTWTTKDDNYTYTHTVSVYRNSQSVPNVPSGKYQANISLSINEFGLIDAVVTSVTRVKTSGDSADKDSYSWQGNVSRKIWYVNKKGKVCQRIVTAHLRKRREVYGKYHTPEGGENGYGFNSKDDGSYGEIYSNITVGAETELD